MDPEQFAIVLTNAQNPLDPQARAQAEAVLSQFREQNYPQYALSLAHQLSNPASSEQIRSLAGLILKNTLTSKDVAQRQALAQKWLSVPEATRTEIKNLSVQTLSSTSQAARGPAAQTVAYIAAIELPHKAWPGLIEGLLEKISSTQDDFQRRAILETLGYICEETDPQVLSQQSNNILTAVCKGMGGNNSVEVTLAACRALLNTLEFIKANFDREAERSYIMTVLCECCANKDVKVRVVAMECLVKVAQLYYDKLPQYIQTIFGLTLKSIREDDESVALQAIEFWSTICDEELDIAFEAEEGYEEEPRTSHRFILGALSYITPVMTECLTKQEDEPDEDLWTVATAAATCLSLITNAVEDEIVPHVMPFIEQNIQSTNWKLKEAATLAFGAILEGPKEKLKPLIVQALPLLLVHMSDSNVYVKDTTAWTIGRVCQLHGSIVATGLSHVMQTLLRGLTDSSRVASYVCFALHNLFDTFQAESGQNTGALSPFYSTTLTGLAQVTSRKDGDEHNLRSSAYETIAVLISAAPNDCLETTKAAVGHFINTFKATLNKNAGPHDQRNELQSSLCGVFQAVIRRFSRADLEGFKDSLMECFLSVPNSHDKFTTASEDALISISALANAVEGDFERYVPNLMPFLLAGLRNFEDYTTCAVSVGLVGDICRAINKKMVPFCDEIVHILFADLQNPQLHRDVKPPILSCFGDIALAIGGDFVKYLPHVMTMLQQASLTKVDTKDYDLVDYLNQLRDGILEAYTGIIVGLKESAPDHVQSYVPGILQFINFVWQDPTKTDSVIKGIVGLIGDIASAYGTKVSQQYSDPFVKNIILESCKNQDSDIQELAQWVKDLLQKIIRG